MSGLLVGLENVPKPAFVIYEWSNNSAELVSKPIKNYDNQKLTPFKAWAAGGNPDDTIYQEIQIEKIGSVFGCIIMMKQENIVNFKFPLLSSDCRSK